LPGPQYRSKEGIRFVVKAKPEDGNPKQLGSISWQALPGTTPPALSEGCCLQCGPGKPRHHILRPTRLLLS